MRVILWACVLLLLQAPWSWGKIYKWIDHNGKAHFTDNPILAHLTKVRAMKVGDAIVKDVDVVVHDISPGREQGLLGMSFLNHFNVTIHTLQDTMNIKPLDQAAGAPRYGGKPQNWWQSKFRFYRRQVSLIDTYLAQHRSPQLEKSRRYFQSELATLERRARLASVPRAWRY